MVSTGKQKTGLEPNTVHKTKTFSRPRPSKGIPEQSQRSSIYLAPVLSIGRPQKQNDFPLATHKNKTIFHWPMAKTKLFSIGPWQKQNYFPLAHSKNETIFHWPMAKTKLSSIGPWQKQNYFSLAHGKNKTGPRLSVHLLRVT